MALTVVSTWGSQRTLWGWECRAILRDASLSNDLVEHLGWPGRNTAPSQAEIDAAVNARVTLLNNLLTAQEMADNAEEALA